MCQTKTYSRCMGLVTSAAIALLLVGGCGSEPESEDALSDRDINIVMDAHAKELMAIEGVTGVAVGALDDGTPSILILIMEESDELAQSLPSVLEGHPVRTLVSGEIKPMQNDTPDTTR